VLVILNVKVIHVLKVFVKMVLFLGDFWIGLRSCLMENKKIFFLISLLLFSIIILSVRTVEAKDCKFGGNYYECFGTKITQDGNIQDFKEHNRYVTWKFGNSDSHTAYYIALKDDPSSLRQITQQTNTNNFRNFRLTDGYVTWSLLSGNTDKTYYSNRIDGNPNTINQLTGTTHSSRFSEFKITGQYVTWKYTRNNQISYFKNRIDGTGVQTGISLEERNSMAGEVTNVNIETPLFCRNILYNSLRRYYDYDCGDTTYLCNFEFVNSQSYVACNGKRVTQLMGPGKFYINFRIHEDGIATWKYYDGDKYAYYRGDIRGGDVSIISSKVERDNHITDIKIFDGKPYWKQYRPSNNQKNWAYFGKGIRYSDWVPIQEHLSDLEANEYYVTWANKEEYKTTWKYSKAKIDGSNRQIVVGSFNTGLSLIFDGNRYLGIGRKYPQLSEFDMKGCTLTWKYYADINSKGNNNEFNLAQSHDHLGCYRGNLAWYDSCGQIEEIKESCINKVTENPNICFADNAGAEYQLEQFTCSDVACVPVKEIVSNRILNICDSCVDGTCTQCTPGETEEISCGVSEIGGECKKRTCSEEGVWGEWPLECSQCGEGI
jgi:hypothetical protein